MTSLDAAAHTVTLGDGSTLQYSKLVLALGGRVRTLPNKGGQFKVRLGISWIRER